MNFTFSEWKMISQAVRHWREDCEKILKECTPKDDELSMYQIYLKQVQKLSELENKIENSVI